MMTDRETRVPGAAGNENTRIETNNLQLPPAALPPIPDGHKLDRVAAREAFTEAMEGRASLAEWAHEYGAALLASPSVVADAGAGDARFDWADALESLVQDGTDYALAEGSGKGEAYEIAEDRKATIIAEVARLTSALDAATRRAEAAERVVIAARAMGPLLWASDDETRAGAENLTAAWRAYDEFRAALAPSRAVPTEDQAWAT